MHTHDTAPTQFITINDTRHAYRRFGASSGTPILCLPHFRAGMDNWDPTVTDGFAKDRPVILFNNAGVASSGGKPADSVDGMAKHVIAFIEATDLGIVDLFGFSLGGFVAQQVTVDRPSAVRRLILAGTGPHGGEDMVEYTPEVARIATNAVPVESDFLYLFFGPSDASQAAGRAFWARRHQRAEQDTPSSPDAMAAQGTAIAAWGAIPQSNRYADLRKIRQPTLIVNGDQDAMVPTINSFIMKHNISGSKLAIYPDAGHGAIFQYPELFLSEVRVFLDR